MGEESRGDTQDMGRNAGGNRIDRAMRALGIDNKTARNAAEALNLLLAQRRARRQPGHASDSPTLASFIEFALPHAGDANGQLFQDLWVLFELGGLRGGYFVEFGATNGRTMSNTHLLEKSFGWKGIVAEPNPGYHADLAAARGCHISHKCVYSRSGAHLPFLCTEQGVFSRLAEVVPDDRHEDSKRQNPTEVMVETITLNDLLDEYGAPSEVDYISVDTEGSEYEILAAFDFDRHRVKCFTVEHNFTPMREDLHRLMTAKGYLRRFPEFSRFDDWYIRADLARSTGA